MLGQALAADFAGLSPVLWDREDVDVTNEKELREKIYKIRPLIIINCVAMTDVDGCEDNVDFAYGLNSRVVETLAGLANELSATLVQYSTVYVFDGKKEDGYIENFKATNPLSVYGKTKLAGEKAASRAQQHYIIRLDRLFGSPGSGKQSFVEKILKASETQKEVKVIADEYGSPTYAPDLAKLTHKILETAEPYGIYHGACEGDCSWHEFAGEIFKIRQISVPLIPVPSSTFTRKAVRPKYGILRNTKLSHQRSWQLALREYLTSL